MDTSSPERRTGLAALLGAAGLVHFLAAAAAAPAAGSGGQDHALKTTIPGPGSRQPPINLQSGPLDLDYRTHHILIRDVTISQGDVTVTADKAEATGLDFENSNWVLTGKVHVKAESEGELSSSQATLEFSHKLLARAVVTGQPAEFQQTRSSTGVLAHGHAGTIDYEVADGTVRLSGDAWLTDGHNEINCPELLYSVRQKQLQGSGGATPCRSQITLQPGPDKRGSADADKSGHDGGSKP